MTKARTVADLGGGVPDPFNPVAVTGTTPSLDVGSYNFFDNGTLTGNTTVSFASVPTNAKWSYTFNTGNTGGWDVSTSTFSQNLSINAQESASQGIAFKPDGTKMYIVGVSGDDVNEYDLSTAWDISTASYLRAFSVSSQDVEPTDIVFSTDGTKMYITGDINDNLFRYSLSTAWNVSTASYDQNLNLASQETQPFGAFFKPDGTELYITGPAGGDVNQYTLSAAWDLSTASFTRNFSVSAQDNGPTSVFFKPDGLAMYVLGNQFDKVNEYSLSTAWNISSASFSDSFDVSSQSTTSEGIFFKPDGTKFYVTGNTSGGRVSEFNVSGSSAVSLPAAVENEPVGAPPSSARVTYDFFTMDGGTTVKLIGEEIV